MKLYSNDLLLILSLLAADPQMESLKVLWGDTVESKVDVIDTIVADENSKLDVIEARIDELTPTLLDSSNISGAYITINTPGNYRLEEDVAAGLWLNSASTTVDLNNHSLVGELVIIGDQCKVFNGSFLPAAATFATIAALAHIASDRVVMKDLLFFCTASAGTAVKGREGIRVDGQYVIIENCVIVSGSASDGDGATTVGADGGEGIHTRSSAFFTLIKNCVISTGNGGSALGSGGVGGDGGLGIWCERSDFVEIIGCTILGTGNGGDGDAGLGTGGAGGTGMLIGTSNFDISVRDCVIKNTGQGGAGATPGAGGRGIFNRTTGAAKSIVLRNKAYNIANTINFALSNNPGTEQGVQINPYPPTTTAINAYANTYVS